MPQPEIERLIMDFYQSQYSRVFETGYIGVLHRKMHRTLEACSSVREHRAITLELGAYGDQHRSHVAHTYEEYTMLDIMFPPGKTLIERDPYVYELGADATQLPYADGAVDRLIASCLIMHMRYPEDTLVEWRRVVRSGGRLSIYVHCDPGILLRVLRRILIRSKARIESRHVHELLQYGQHAVSYPAVMTFIRHVFGTYKIQERKFPFRWLPWDLNLWTIVDIELTKRGNSS